MGARITCLLCTFIISCGACLANSGHVVTLEDLSSIKAVDYKVEISPDGKSLAYVVGDSLSLVSTEANSVPRQVSNGRLPRWSPDGSQIAFYSTDSGTFQLWVMDVETLRKRQITNVEGGIAPQGRTVGYW